MEGQLGGLSLPYRRIEAIDGERIDRVPPSDLALTNGEVACHLSHRCCWAELVASGAPHALVLEDDVVLSPRVPAFLARPELLPEDADLVRLETRVCNIGIVGRSRRIEGGLALHRMVTVHFGAAGYIITRACARRLLASDLTEIAPVDHMLFEPPLMDTFRVYQVDPGLCIQGDVLFGRSTPQVMHSDIEPLRNLRYDARWGAGWRNRRPGSLRELMVTRAKAVLRPYYHRLAYGIRYRNIVFEGGRVAESET